MVAVDREFAERLSGVARLLDGDDDSDAVLRRLVRLGVELLPPGAAAALTVVGGNKSWTFASSDPRIDELHCLQFDSGDGPVVETLRYNEARHVPDTGAEQRWPEFCQAAADAGFGSCIFLPLRTDRGPAGAVALYGKEPHAFRGAAHDIALLFAAQGGTAVHNAALYRAARKMIDNLQTALESRAVIEQAKGILHAELGVEPEYAFHLLRRMSQNTNTKVREVSAAVVQGRMDAGGFRPGRAPGSADSRPARSPRPRDERPNRETG